MARELDMNLRSKIGNIPMDDGPVADNLAIALCSYYEDHPDRPENDPEGESGWGEWVVARVYTTLDKIVNVVNERVEARRSNN